MKYFSKNNLGDNPAIIKLNSLIIAILCSSNLLFYLIYIGLKYSRGFYIITPVVFALSLISFLVKPKLKVEEVKSLFFLVLIVLLLYFISFFTGQIGDSRFIILFGYCLIPIFSLTLDRDTKAILEYIMVISLFTMPFVKEFFSYQYVTLQQTDMSKAYAIFITVSASILHFFFYGKNTNLLIKICYLYNTYLLYKLMSVGNRGVIASIAFLGIILLVRTMQRYDIPKKTRRKVIIVFATLAGLILILFFNLDTVVIWLYNFFQTKFSTTPSFIIKTYKLIVYKSDVSNGRDSVYNFFIEAILKSPIWGYGMDMSEKISEGLYPYPHNYILQMLFEGGILFASYPICISIYSIIRTFLWKIKNRSDEIFAVFLLCNCVPKLLVSGDIWNQIIFWMWLAYSAINLWPHRRHFR